MNGALALAALTTVALAQPTGAEPDRAAALEQLRLGAEAFEQGEYQAALARFEQAYRLVPSPRIKFNLGQTLRKLGRDVEALDAFESYLAGAPSEPPQRRQEAESAVAELGRQVGALRIESAVPGADVLVDGRHVGRTPLVGSVRVPPGFHQVVVERSGYRAFVTRADVRAGESAPIRVALEPEPAALPGPRPAKPAPRLPDPPPPAANVLGTAEASRGDSAGAGYRIGGWAALAVGVAGIATGILMGLRVQDKVAAREAADRDPGATDEVKADLDAAGKSAQTFQFVGYGAGGALLGLGAVLLYMGYSSEQAPRSVARSPDGPLVWRF